MNTRADIHQELFSRLAARDRMNPFRPALDAAAVLELKRAAARISAASLGDAERDLPPGDIRRFAMDAAVAALRVVYSIDDALS